MAPRGGASSVLGWRGGLGRRGEGSRPSYGRSVPGFPGAAGAAAAAALAEAGLRRLASPAPTPAPSQSPSPPSPDSDLLERVRRRRSGQAPVFGEARVQPRDPGPRGRTAEGWWLPGAELRPVHRESSHFLRPRPSHCYTPTVPALRGCPRPLLELKLLIQRGGGRRRGRGLRSWSGGATPDWMEDGGFGPDPALLLPLPFPRCWCCSCSKLSAMVGAEAAGVVLWGGSGPQLFFGLFNQCLFHTVPNRLTSNQSRHASPALGRTDQGEVVLFSFSLASPFTPSFSSFPPFPPPPSPPLPRRLFCSSHAPLFFSVFHLNSSLFCPLPFLFSVQLLYCCTSPIFFHFVLFSIPSFHSPLLS
ncbi:uncharacterized protein [Notamacropus eugenii]|uniref:uncharacterized protein n=1 Tax=Notamacropus eugenii TaxID=9315 RepID=UPI003B674274